MISFVITIHDSHVVMFFLAHMIFKILFVLSAGRTMHKPLERDEVTRSDRRPDGIVSEQISEVKCGFTVIFFSNIVFFISYF